MAETSVITDEVREKLGKEVTEPVTLEIEAGAIRKFCQAVGDTNPLWQDEACAGKSRFGSIIAPPGFISQFLFWEGKQRPRISVIETTAPRTLAGETDFEYFQLVRPGDRITASTKLVDAYERQGKTGKLLFLVSESTYTNQKGELVATERSTGIHY